MQTLDNIPDGALAIAAGKIVAVGTTAQIGSEFTADQVISAQGKVVCPGFVDCHTHLVYAGDRLMEFEMRIGGASYLEIMAAGGGIVRTAQAVRNASVAQLVAESLSRLQSMLALGTTTAEVKTGYGLTAQSELHMLEAIGALAQQQPVTLAPTFLGAHAIPAEYKADPQAYTELVIREMLPAAAEWYRQSVFFQRELPFFCDVFCEQNAFTLAQSRQVLIAGKALGMQVKIHADEFTSLGGVGLAVELGAVSVDHLDVTTAQDFARLAGSAAVGVMLPAVNFNLGSSHFASARAFLAAGGALALSTDINPGSAPCPSLPFVMALACRYQKLSPTEALHAVTINAAHALGLGHRVGSLEVGKQADFLLLQTNDYRALAYEFGGNLVEQVWKAGEQVIVGKQVLASR
jgi:imidazolonepropionase